MIGLQMQAQSAASGAASSTTPGLKTNAQRLAAADTAAASAQTPATTTAATGKAESLQVASKEYDAVKELARMTKRYSLTKEQKAKIEPLLLEQQKQVHTLGEDESLTDAEWAGAVRQVHQADGVEGKKAADR